MAKPEESLLTLAEITEIAQRHSRTPAQVLLRWAIQRGTSVVPKSVNSARQVENISVFDFALTEEEMTGISALNQNKRYNDPGVFAEAAFGCFCPIYE